MVARVGRKYKILMDISHVGNLYWRLSCHRLVMLLFLVCLGFSHSLHADSKGPLEVKSQYPPFIPYLNPSFQNAETAGSKDFLFRWDFSHFNTQQYNSQDRKTELGFDMETTRNTFTFTYGFFNRLDFSLEIPIYSFHRGGFDSAIQGYHNAFGFPNGGREYFSNYDFKYRMKDHYETRIDARPNTSMGDSIGYLKIQALYESRYLPSLSLFVAGKFSTGNKNSGMGSGQPDYAGGITVKKRISSFVLYIQGAYTYTSKYHDSWNIRIHPFFTAGYCLEYVLNEKWSILTQINDMKSPYGSQESQLNEFSSILSIGGKFRLESGTILSFSFTEDLTHKSNTDIGINFAISKIRI